jgi:transposase-like protein
MSAEEKTPAEIRAEIEATRSEMGDTVEALAEKTDVKAQAKAKVEDVKAKAKAAAPESPQEGVAQAQTLVKQNPKPAAIGAALVVLFILWRLLRS